MRKYNMLGEKLEYKEIFAIYISHIYCKMIGREQNKNVISG